MKTNRGFGKILLILILASLAFYFFVYKEDVTLTTIPDETNEVIADETNEVSTEGLVGKNCYEYNKTTSSFYEPYTANEMVELVVSEDKVVTGFKKIIQRGPTNMTSIYEGTLTGVLEGDTLKLDYLYKMGDLERKEEEIYILKSDSIVRQKYNVEEPIGGGDTTIIPVKGFVYKKVDCVLVN